MPPVLPVFCLFQSTIPHTDFMNSSPVHSSQTSIHADLERLVRKHAATEYLRPIPPFSAAVFAEICGTVQQWLQEHPSASIVLDSCCGTGESTAHLARRHTNAFVIGIDKSAHRTKKHGQLEHNNDSTETRNYQVWRADCEDIWRLLPTLFREQKIICEKHYCLYPNPYPKPHHILRRWHGHPLFSHMLALSAETEMRTNWRVYAEECAEAARILGYTAHYQELSIDAPFGDAMTAFERKYAASGHTLYKICMTKQHEFS
ncbi:MAG: SAM-dependent methyltransferase [Candidatus Kapaibacterium sp.]|nr:MAG: SAM-dependent methyltransferase [Candidatus Kapabacteria bacterium]